MSGMHFKKCPEDASFIRYISGELSASEAGGFLGHASRCPRCRLRLSALATLQAELEAREKDLPDFALSSRDAVEFRKMAREQERTYTSGDGNSFSKVIRLGGIAAAGILLVFIGTRLFIKTSPAGSIIRGRDQAELRLHLPQGELREAPGWFSWSEIKGTDFYHLEIVATDLSLVFRTSLEGTRLRLPDDVRQRLKRQKPYLWTVSAHDDENQELTSASAYFEIR